MLIRRLMEVVPDNKALRISFCSKDFLKTAVGVCRDLLELPTVLELREKHLLSGLCRTVRLI